MYRATSRRFGSHKIRVKTEVETIYIKKNLS